MPGVIHIKDITDLKNINNLKIKKSDEIAEASYLFLKNILSNKTLTNAFGIGLDAKFNKVNLNKFIEEFNLIVNESF